jgi:YebC/PmpR family DNA-binding regulatory protein
VSGHSKWATIKRKKGALDARRGQLFSKLTRAIIAAAREGGTDPNGNLALQNAIVKARVASMPKDNIDRAIARGAGETLQSAEYEYMSYEGYGPEGVAVYVEALTDNRNRTASDVRRAFAKSGGKLGESGSVAYLFDRKSCVTVLASGLDEDSLMAAATEGDADDVIVGDGVIQVIGAPQSLGLIRTALETAGVAIDSASLEMIPKTTIRLTEESAARRLLRLIEELADNDDVQDVYANCDIPDHLLEAPAL